MLYICSKGTDIWFEMSEVSETTSKLYIYSNDNGGFYVKSSIFIVYYFYISFKGNLMHWVHLLHYNK